MPGPHYQALFCAIYRKSPAELGFTDVPIDPRTLELARDWPAAASTASRVWEEDMNRRDLIKSAAYATAAFTTPLGALLDSPTEMPSRNEGDRLVDAGDIGTIGEMTAMFSKIDNRYGGGQIRSAVVDYLGNEVAPLLRRGRFDALTGQRLFLAAAELTRLVGWMSHDVGDHGRGQQYLIQSLSLARSAGDDALVGEILAAMSHQASFLGDGGKAVDLAGAAGHIARRRGIAALVAEAHVMEAHGYATLGEDSRCARALHDAELALDQADRDADPHWIGYFDESYLSAKFGHCFRVLGDNANAIKFAERSLIMNSDQYARGYAFNLSLLAHSHAQLGNVEEACRVGEQAVSATATLRSSRATKYVKALGSTLNSAAATSPSVQKLTSSISQIATAA